MPEKDFNALFRKVLELDLLPSYEKVSLDSFFPELTEATLKLMRLSYSRKFLEWSTGTKLIDWQRLAKWNSGVSSNLNSDDLFWNESNAQHLTVERWNSFVDFLERKHQEDELISLVRPLELDRPPTNDFTQRFIERNPTFDEASIERIVGILKDFFPKQATQLKSTLETGEIPNPKLVFHGSGKTLLDMFKQLMKGQFLTVPVQKDLEKWIANGFEFMHQGKPKAFTEKYASKIISENDRAAKGNRLIDVKSVDGRFVIEQLEIRNRQ